jgi:signal transduction histidine kinase
MLRRKFLIRVGLLICAFVLGAAVAIWALQDQQAELQRVTNDSRRLLDSVQAIGLAVNEAVAGRMHAGASPGAERAAAALTGLVDELGQEELFKGTGEAAERFRQLAAALPGFVAPAGGAGASDGAGRAEADLGMHRLVQQLSSAVRSHIAGESVRVAQSFRGLVIALTLAALVMVNVAIFVLLRTVTMVLKPVGALVEGSRELAAERFEHRVLVDRGDEFGELAHAYNSLAAQLQSNEQRRTETLRQLAVTLNHELNNTLSIIELQLSLLDRRAGKDPAAAKPMREIRAGLMRMARTVASLKDIRRVVLMDYPGGEKMIDLARSVAREPSGPATSGDACVPTGDRGAADAVEGERAEPAGLANGPSAADGLGAGGLQGVVGVQGMAGRPVQEAER